MIAILRFHMDTVKLYVLAAIFLVPAPVIPYEARSERQGVLSIIDLQFALDNIGSPRLILAVQYANCRLISR